MNGVMDEERAEALRMIRESTEGLAPRNGDRKRIRALRFKSPGFDPEIFRQMAEQGWVGLSIPEVQGGAGLGMAEFCAIAEALGAALSPEPLVQAALSVRLLAASKARAPLEKLLAGERYIATAWAEAPNALTALGTPDAARLFIPCAGGAAGFLVPVRTGKGLALYLQASDNAALTLDDTQDGGQFGTLTPDAGVLLADDIGAALSSALDEATLATSATLLGVMDQAFALTLDFLRTRQQFGKFIGSFQALQHRAADLHLQIALTRASVEAAAAVLDDAAALAASRHAAVSAAKARASEAAMLITRQAVQFHGGIGYTDEADIGLYLRKAMVLANQFGSAKQHRLRYAAVAAEEEV
jgi:alkylation response protein AidB-like acyl-CoA dehydrogenase